MIKAFRNFLRVRGGNIAPLMGLLAIPLIGAAGLAVDYGSASQMRSKLQNAADAAAIGVIAKSAPALKSIGKGKLDKAAAKKDGGDIFKASSYTLDFKLKALNVDVRQAGLSIKSRVTFTAEVPTHFMGVFGRGMTEIAGSAEAEIENFAYSDIFMLVDNSPSMGMAATMPEIRRLQGLTRTALVPDGCAFACHDLSGTMDWYKVARDNRITLRVDLVREAVGSLFKTVEAARHVPSQFQMRAYSFGRAATSQRLTQIVSPTTDMTRAKTGVDQIQLMTTPFNGYDHFQNSPFDAYFAQLNSIIPRAGDGTSESNRQPYLFFISDGVADASKPRCSEMLMPETRCLEAIDWRRLCEPLKRRGVKIAVLYTTYLPQPGDWLHRDRMQYFLHKVEPAMEACSSPDLYMEVAPGDNISEALRTLFMKAVATPRLTN